MIPELFWVPGPWRGRLAVATRPRGGDWLGDEAKGLREVGVDMVVSLLEKEEAGQLELGREGEVANSNHLQFISLPIPDRGVPGSISDALSLLRTIIRALEEGKGVAVHCRQGVGRSGLIVAGVLIASGLDAEKAIRTVSNARGATIPETPDQLEWIRQLVPQLALVRP